MGFPGVNRFFTSSPCHTSAHLDRATRATVQGMYNDAVMANKVREAILLAPGISAQDIVIAVRERVVTLSGEVDTPEQARLAEDAAANVEGVARVENDLYVRPGRWPPAEPEILPWHGGR